MSARRTRPPTAPTLEAALARRIGSAGPARSALLELLAKVDAVDRAAYRAVRSPRSPTLDVRLAQLSNAANYSRLWLGFAGALALMGGRRQRRAAALGIAAIGVTSAVVNLVVKPVFERDRPDRPTALGAEIPHVRMPASTSFPSGHAASAFAFASAVGGELPAMALPLRLLASAVAYSRVHTGVHYPADVVAGSIVGAAAAAVVRRTARRTQHPLT